VVFDFDGESKEVTSKSLSLVEGETGVPVDELVTRSEAPQGQSIALVSNSESNISSENGSGASMSGSRSNIIFRPALSIEPQTDPSVMDSIVENEENEPIPNEGVSINANATELRS